MSVSQLSEQLAIAGIYTEVFTTTANGETELDVLAGEKLILDGVPVTYFRRITKDHTHFSPALLIQLWKEVQSFDIVHIHAWWNLVSVFSCWIALKRGVPVVISPRGTLSAYSFSNRNTLTKQLIHKVLGKRLLSRSSFHVTSEREKQAIENLTSNKRIVKIFNFVSLPGTSLPPVRKHVDNRSLKLLFFSRIEEKKGLDILLNSLAKVNVSFHLTIAGDGESAYVDRLKSISASNGTANRVSWIGFQRLNKFDIMLQHDLMVLPSHDENFGNVVIESLSVGTAVLVSKNVGLADYVYKNELGWICGLDQDEISTAINHIFTQNEKLQSIRRSAVDIIRNDFNEGLLSKEYISMYQQIIDNARI